MMPRELPGALEEDLWWWWWERRPHHTYLACAREERTAEMRGDRTRSRFVGVGHGWPTLGAPTAST